MDQKRIYTKTIILSKYKIFPPPSNFDKSTTEKLGIYSEAAIEPMSIKMPVISSEMIFTQKFKESPRQQKTSPVKQEEIKEIPKEKIIQDKIAVFSFVSTYLNIDPKSDTWYYYDNRELAAGFKGPYNALEMDKLWKSDKLAIIHAFIYSEEIAFMQKSGDYNKSPMKIDEFVPLEILLDHSIFTKIKKREVTQKEPISPSGPIFIPHLEQNTQSLAPKIAELIDNKLIEKTEEPMKITRKEEPTKIVEENPISEQNPKQEKPKKEAKKQQSKETKKKSKEERKKNIEQALEEGFDIVEKKPKGQKSKKQQKHVEEEEEDFIEQKIPENKPAPIPEPQKPKQKIPQPTVVPPIEKPEKTQETPPKQEKIEPVPEPKKELKKEEKENSDSEDDFEFMPTKSKLKRMKKNKKAGKATPVEKKKESDDEEQIIIPVQKETPKKEEPEKKQAEPKKQKGESKKKGAEKSKGKKSEPVEEKEQPKQQPPPENVVIKKKKNKQEVDPSILGIYFDKPKKEKEEPETWGVPQEPEKVLSIDELMKEEQMKAKKTQKPAVKKSK